MTQEQQERIVDKLRKILALTTSPVEGEAQAAAEMLQKLLTEYNLSVADLESRGTAKKPGVQEQGHDLGKAAFYWKLDLAEVIADHYYCWSLVDRYAKTVTFIGRPDNVEALKMLYAWVIDQIRRLSTDTRKEWMAENRAHIDPLRWQVNFGLGVVSRLGKRLEELRERQASGVTALVLSHKSEISDYMEEKYGRRIDGKKTKRDMEWDREWAERLEVKELLKKTDLEAYYNAYPHERPLTPEQQAVADKELDAWRKKQDRAMHRRVGRAPKRIDYVKEDQAYEANVAGRRSADKVNLEPFLKGGKGDVPKISG